MTGTERAAAEGYAGSYVAHHVPGEHARLRTLEAAFDPATFRVLGRLELPADAHCLDLGAGAGSVAAWLAARHPLGQITATDSGCASCSMASNSLVSAALWSRSSTMVVMSGSSALTTRGENALLTSLRNRV